LFDLQWGLHDPDYFSNRCRFCLFCGNCESCETCNDCWICVQWGGCFNQTGRDWGIKARNAWAITTGSSSVHVGIIDSGIDSTHPDLIGNIGSGWNFFVNCETCDEDYGSSCESCHPEKLDTSDITGHGTHVAGIVGARTYTATPTGVAGINWDITLRPLKIGNQMWGVSRILAAIGYAINDNIPILNFSGGFFNTGAPFAAILANYTGLLVASAGNEGGLCININCELHSPPIVCRHDTQPAWISRML
jgi:subtilisin family serine protease